MSIEPAAGTETTAGTTRKPSLKKNVRDAGNRSLNHYKSSMSPWRFRLRQRLLPLVRLETPYLAWIQEHTRCAFLDEYFALTANLGTHTFFVIMLPVPFWFGYVSVGRGLVYTLGYGVYVTGFLKDMLCLPRPMSPPLHRITMSGSAALEYGFPSTHSTNAVSAALVVYYAALESAGDWPAWKLLALRAVCWQYVVSIVLGRLYCGMHGFLDVIAGSFLGWLLWYLRATFGPALDAYIASGRASVLLVMVPIMLALVRVHSEPVDPCPCFEDSVAFAGVVLGVDLGLWHYASSPHSMPNAAVGTIPYASTLGVPVSVLRVVLGIVWIFVWRAITKRTLHTYLPPLYRVIDRLGLSIPRGSFVNASEYTNVPASVPDTTLVEAREIPGIIHTVTRRGRSDSVGPQSTADMYEAMAQRDRKRRKSLDLNEPGLDDDEDEDAIFANIKPPRVQYDVEVVTKLIVYAGIGWIGVEGCGLLYESVGLGLNVAAV
ncbi:phosphatidic acid phosphatase type 2/haloperoxidase [Dipodascopsis tothii]|uniref:phosphatidic acid phosphatase type 2/haloperoxidase n=1 Tax=Dipodascopsis tothii TaxID=44089 RepID=UPI0034CDED8F